MNLRILSLTHVVLSLIATYSVDAVYGNEPTKRPHNLVLISTDDQGDGDLGCFVAKDLRTLNIDRLATKRIKLTDFHVLASVCSPSRAALLTGCYPKRTDVSAVLDPKLKIGLRFDRLTLAEILKSAGDATMCVGKWHLGHTSNRFPTERGFDEYFGIPYSHDMRATPGNHEKDTGLYRPVQRDAAAW